MPIDAGDKTISTGAKDAIPAERALNSDARQRIDKWLWFVRVVKSRTSAASLVTDGKVRVNRERVEKASHLVKPGDVLTIGLREHVRILEVVAPGLKRGSAPEAARLFKDLTPPPLPRPTRAEIPSGEREAGSGRPTKRERRQTDRLRDEFDEQ
jgi:ribosome-associated heat shock protein Hsp15